MPSTKTLLALLLVLALLPGCDACDTATAGSGDAAASDTNLADAYTYTYPNSSLLELSEIPIERLCEALYSGNNRTLWAQLFGLGGLGQQIKDQAATCGGEVDQRSFDILGLSPDLAKIECQPNAPNWTRTLNQRIMASVAAGRSRYDGRAARSCLDEGHSFIDERGGLIFAFAPSLDGGVLDAAFIQSACEGWLVGLVESGGVCDEHWECQDGMFCKRSAQGCQGVCIAPQPEGASCDAFDRCVEGASCVEGLCVGPEPTDAGVDSDAAVVNQGQRCGSLEAGVAVCAEGLYCDDNSFCMRLPDDGEPCTADGRCATGLTCGPGADGEGLCGPPRAAGEECTEYTGACQDCVPCVSDGVDGGPSHCRPLRLLGESCGPNVGSCTLGLICARDACRTPALAGETCFVDADSDNQGGSCVALGDFCEDEDGDGQGLCRVRHHEGETCQAAPLATSTGGSCQGSYLFCRREQASDTQGMCARTPLPGEPCANRYDLNGKCTFANPHLGVGSVECRGVNDAGPGTCRSSDAPPLTGDPCSSNSQCLAEDYCDQTDGVCKRAASLGELCADTGQRCAGGLCTYQNTDAGYAYVCVPFLAQGEDCGYAGDKSCGPQARCAGNDDAGYRCSPLGQTGETCSSSAECAAALDCLNGVCAAGGVCARDGCYGCQDTSSLTTLIFMAIALPMGTRRRRRLARD